MKITIRHKCGHYELHTVEAKTEKDIARIEIAYSKTYCTDCAEEIQRQNRKFNQKIGDKLS